MMNETELLNTDQGAPALQITRARIRAKLRNRTIRDLTLAEIRTLFDSECKENTSRARSFFMDSAITVR